MSKSNYGEMLALLEYVDRKKDKNKGRVKKEYGFKEYMKFKKEIEEFEKWEKSMLKKDVKQEEKKSGPKIGALHIAMILIASFPIIAPLYTWWIKSILAW